MSALSVSWRLQNFCVAEHTCCVAGSNKQVLRASMTNSAAAATAAHAADPSNLVTTSELY